MKKNIESYIKMARGYDGAELIVALRGVLPRRSTVLEIGMGPGVDLDLLRRAGYAVTGSDSSKLFLERYRGMHPTADLLLLDARTFETERQFDGIYSNKVLHHLTRLELLRSFQRQYELLRPHGIMLHSMWYGDRLERMHGLYFVYYTEETIQEVMDERLETLKIERYSEMSTGDSLYVMARKRG